MMKLRRGVTVLVVSLGIFALAGPVGAATVLFDQGHGQMFRIEQDGPLHLGRLAGLFRQAGAEVGVLSPPISAAALADVDVLLSSGPFRPFSAEEIAALDRFIKEGGRFVLMLHIAPPTQTLLQQLGVDFSNGVVRERNHVIDGNVLDFLVDDLAAHPVTDGLDNFALYGSWALRARQDNVAPLARTSPLAWVDLNGDKNLGGEDAVQVFAVALHGKKGRGEFLVFGDDAVFQTRFLQEQNLQLAKNMVRWALGR